MQAAESIQSARLVCKAAEDVLAENAPKGADSHEDQVKVLNLLDGAAATLTEASRARTRAQQARPAVEVPEALGVLADSPAELLRIKGYLEATHEGGRIVEALPAGEPTGTAEEMRILDGALRA